MRRSHVIIAVISVIAVVVAIFIVSSLSSTDSPTSTPTVTPTATASPVAGDNINMGIDDLKPRATLVLRAYFLPPGQSQVSSDDLQRYTTSRMQQELTDGWDGALDNTSVSLDSLTFSTANLPRDSNRELTLEACAVTTTKFENGESDYSMSKAIVTMLYNDGWRVDAISEIDGCDEGDDAP